MIFCGNVLMSTLYHLSKPTIACVQGPAFGGALGLIACCDLAVSAVEAEFCFSETRLGLIPAVISPYVIKAIGPRQAKRYFLTAERFSATQAQAIGLIHEVTEVEALQSKAMRWAEALIENEPQALTMAKKLIHLVQAHPLDETMQHTTAECIAKLRCAPESQARLKAFLAKSSNA